ncbi:MAG: phage tail length tape measure family protein [Pseudomonadaceae bacterium]|nr:phage tail length tape measure family protein [Pseudomonadaceae bacterium]
MSIKDRLIQFVLRGKDELSPEAAKSTEALAAVSAEAEELGKVLDSAKDARGLAKGLEATQRAAEQAERGLVQTDLQIKELRDALNQSPGSAGLEQSLKDTEREARRLQRGLDGLREKLKQQEAAALAAGIDTNNLADEEKRLAAEVDKAKVALDANSQQLKVLQREQAAAARTTAEHASRVEDARSAMSTGAKQVLAFAAAYISLNAVVGVFQGGLRLVAQGIRAVAMEGSDKQQALAQLESALASTGRQAEFTTQQLLDMADGLEASSMLTAEQVQAAQTRLLSYTNVAATEFPRAMQIIIDQQQRLGISVEQSAEIVGRALQSPSEAIATLGRQGFKLEDGQKRLLKQLEATGKTAEAQAIIMDMLAEAYGGSAAAARMNTAAGLWKGLTDRVGDFTSRVANSGAFDFIQRKLVELSTYLDEMANDGRLDVLAKGLSDAFIQGAEKVEAFAKKLLDIDFKKLTEDSGGWLSDFGSKIDEATTRLQLFVAPFRTLFSGLTAGFATLGLAATEFAANLAAPFLAAGEAIADAFNLEGLKAKIQASRQSINDLQAGLLEQIERDGQDIRDAWDTTTQAAVENAQDQQAAAVAAEAAKLAAAQATASKVAELNEGFAQQAVEASATGQRAITDMADALKLIDTASSVQQLEGLRGALLKAYQDGRISQEQYAQASSLLNGKLGELGSAADDTGDSLAGLGDEFNDMAGIMRAVGSAMNEVDFNRLRAGIRKAYGEGKISVEEFAKAQAELNKRITELKPAADEGTKALSEQRKAIGENMEAARRGVSDVGDEAEGAAGAVGFFGSVLTAARTPLANMSKAALEAFDALRGIKNTDIELDVSSAEKTAAALSKVREEVLGIRAELGLAGSRASGFGIWAQETALASREVQAQFLEQRLRLQELMAGYEAGSIGLEDFTRRAAAAGQSLTLLDESDLSSLEGALDAAKQKMEALGEYTRGTLASLQMELLQLQGTQDEIERAKFASRRNDLLAQQADAQRAGDSAAIANLALALRTLNEIEDVSAAKRQQADQQKRAEEVAKATPPVTAAAKVIRLETARGKAVEVAVNSATDETNLLSILEEAGLRSI